MFYHTKQVSVVEITRKQVSVNRSKNILVVCDNIRVVSSLLTKVVKQTVIVLCVCKIKEF